MKSPVLVLVFIGVWLILVIIGLIRPQTYLRLLKWQMRTFAKIYGFKAEPQSDEEVCRRIRILYAVLLVFGLFILGRVLIGG
jgi:hypothetical protein